MIKLNLDFPSAAAPLNRPQASLIGWIATDEGPIERISLASRELSIAATRIERPDVAATYPGWHAQGFSIHVPFAVIEANGAIALAVTIAGRDRVISSPVAIDMRDIESFRKAKADKRARILPLLACPACGTGGLREGARASVQCPRCSITFDDATNAVNLLTKDAGTMAGIRFTENVSSHDYDPVARNLIKRYRDGLILDNGSGSRGTYYANVVNFEIVDYATTDVLGIAERLPFKDAAFDCVFSLAVLEHVKDPFAAAREIERVLKPGGTLYAAVPLLQPVHGFPDHYYNMTSSGLRNLFPRMEAVELTVPASGLPIFALTWIIQAWHRGLPTETRDRFSEMRIGDFLSAPESFLEADFVAQLGPGTNNELACLNTLLARKPVPSQADVDEVANGTFDSLADG